MSTATATALALEATGLRKSFGETVALDGIDLRVAEGTIFALLGPNGAGKTTAVQILSTLIGADQGEVRVAGHDATREPEAVRGVIGVTGQFSAVDTLLTAEENLALMADLHHLDPVEGRRRAAELLERFELADESSKPAGLYSGGMRRRLDLAMTLMGDPRIIFLDEPTTGLDPGGRRTVWRIVRELVARGVTILLTTHYLEEADALADRIGLLDHGSLIAEGTPDELKRRIPGGHIGLTFADRDGLEAAAAAFPEFVRDEDALTLRAPSDGDIASLRALLAELDGAGIRVERLSVHTPDLDDVFLALTGRSEREEER
ncbi:MAG: ATP-binding cassette domain-containing protein [Actinomycetota bacterium]